MFKNCTINYLDFFDTNINILSVSNCVIDTLSQGISTISKSVNKVNIEKCHVKWLTLEDLHSARFSNNKIVNLVLGSIDEVDVGNQKLINNLKISSIKNLVLKGQKIDELTIRDCPELCGQIEFNNCHRLNLLQSSFKNVVISNSDFNTINDFDLLTSDYQGIRINELEYPRQLIDRNTHRLLKRIAIQNNDLINGKLQGIQELICYKKELWKEKNIFNWIPLWAGYWTNKYGSSVKFAFISWLVTSLAFFILASIFYSMPFLEQFFSGRFFIFALNPTHAIESVFPGIDSESFRPTILTVDYIGRIFAGFMIFQVVSAFRFFFKNN